MSENQDNIKNKKVNKKRKNKALRAVLIVLVLCILVIAGVAWYKLSRIDVQEIDTSALEVNDDLYNDVSDRVSKSAFILVNMYATFNG